MGEIKLMVKRTCEDILKFGTLEGGRPPSQENPLQSFYTMFIYVHICEGLCLMQGHFRTIWDA